MKQNSILGSRMLMMLQKMIKNRILQHIAFWSISFYILLRHFQASSHLSVTDFMYTGTICIFLIFCVYTNLNWLVPAYFQKEKYVTYFFLVAAIILGTSYLQILLFDPITEFLFLGYYLISYFEFWPTSQFYLIFVGITSLLHFSKIWFLYKESQAELERTSKEKKIAELEALKNQLDPHYLFNSLNSIYSLVLNKSDQAPTAVLKLSDTMRYVLYESNGEKVLLNKELEFISDYIDLQKLRMVQKDQLKFSTEGKTNNLSIAPLLLILPIENAFKFAMKGDPQHAFIIISIEINNNRLNMTIENSYDSETISDNNQGLGLTNLRKRLEIIYPARHNLKIDKTEDKFTFNLKIDL